MRIPRLGGLPILFAATLVFAQERPGREPPAFRLGDTATPLEYALTLALEPRETRFAGEVRIVMRVNRATPVLWLNATDLTIESAEIQQGSRKLQVAVLAGGEDFVGFEAHGTEFTPGIAIATIRYNAPFEPVSSRGLFRQQDRGDWYVISQFEAISARRAFPCFDEPGWKTAWKLTIDAPTGQVVVSNTPETKSGATPRRPGWTRHEFAQTKPLPTYLVAMAVGPFDVLDGGSAGQKKTKLRYFTPKGRAAEARYAKEVTPRLLELLEDYFGMAYPFEKLDSVSVPQTVGFGAMENVGMITYASSLIVATPREETPAFQRRYAAVAAHEMAHMWFGDLVTLAWWDDTWLNEAFASWMGNKIVARYRPDWDSGWSVGYARGRALELDRLASARRVRNPVNEKTEIWGAFDAITYNKGSAVLAMFENAFSPERFREGVRSFLKRHAWSTATSNDFIRALGEAAGKREEALAAFKSFIEQPGVPLIDVALHCTNEGASLDLYQRRLRPLGSSAGELEWTTPACFRYAKSTRCTDMKNGTQTLPLPEATSCPAWVLGNAGGRAHYVPRYDGATGERLRAGSAALSPNEMVSALIDARVLSESGLMALGEALAWADAGLAHPSPVARLFALSLLDERRDAWLTPLDAAAKRDILARRLRPLAAELGWREKPGESDDLRELRPAVMRSAALDDADGGVRAEARALAAAWLANHDAVSATMLSAVLDTAARFGEAELFERLAGILTTTEDLRERDYVREAVAKARDAKLRARALALTLQLNGRDAFELLLEELDDPANRRPGLEFLRANYDALVAKLPEHSMAAVMRVVGDICTPDERELFVGLFKDRAAKYLDGPRQYRQSLERIDLCLAARGTH